jgi:transposase
MTQKDLVVSFHDEGLSAKEIHERLVDIFGGLTMPYSTVTGTLRETCWTPSEERSQNFGGRPSNFDHDRRILSVLA